MMLTEEQADETWCFAADMDIARGKHVNSFDPNRDACCIGSSCMAWRWEDHAVRVKPGAPPVEIHAVPRGYCGLAGTPAGAAR